MLQQQTPSLGLKHNTSAQQISPEIEFRNIIKTYSVPTILSPSLNSMDSKDKSDGMSKMFSEELSSLQGETFEVVSEGNEE